jgi:integrase
MSKKRGNGEGSITRRKDGLYMARYTLDTPTGAKRKTLYAKTRKEVSEKLMNALAHAQKGIVAEPSAMALGTFLERWLEDSVRGSVRQSTYQRDESLCRVHLVPGLGKKKLKTLNAADVQRFYRAKLDSGLSSATVHKLHVILHKALKQAVRWGLTPRNVADDVDAPKIHKDEVTPLVTEEAREFLETARGDKLEALYILAVQSGLRQGELLALRWEDVDLEARTLQVRRTLTRNGGKLAVGPTKTALRVGAPSSSLRTPQRHYRAIWSGS